MSFPLFAFTVPTVPGLRCPSSRSCTPRHVGVRQIRQRRLRPRAARIVTIAKAEDPSADQQQSPDTSEGQNGPSRTVLGRVIVEVFSLVVGALLLLVVVAWRVSQVISLNIWKALVWISNVRQLGKWAVSRMANVDSITIPVASFTRALRRFYGMAFDGFLHLENDSNAGAVLEVKSPTSVQDGVHQNTQDSAVDLHAVQDADYRQQATAVTGRRLILLRHAKTMWENETPDHDRVLSAKGKEEARLVGSELGRMAWLPDVVLCSDAVRTVQTLSLLDMPEQIPADTTCTESLYYAVTGEEMALALDEALGEKGFRENSTLMVVCHNPGCEELVEQLSGHRPEMGTGCAALLQYHVEETAQAADEDSFRIATQKKQWSLVEMIRPSLLSSTSASSIE